MSTSEIADIFQALGQVSVRRLFSGQGIYHRGFIIAIDIDGELRLKADAISAPAFETAGATQWIYDGRRGLTPMPYWSIPGDAFEDADIMGQWTRRAYEAALRSGKSESGARKQPAGHTRSRSGPR